MQEADRQNYEVDDRGSRSLSIAALIFVAMAAVMGWGASFVGLHEYGMQSMAGFDYWTAWLVPATFDGAAFACTLMTYRSSINGRSAFRGRVLMWAFTAVSSWINWIHQPSPEAQIVAAGLPIAAVAVFDVVLIELRADYEARHGKRGFRLRPGLLTLRWMVDRRGTRDAFRKQVMDIPVEEIAGLGPMSVVTRQREKVPAGAEQGTAELDAATRLEGAAALKGSAQLHGSAASTLIPDRRPATEISAQCWTAPGATTPVSGPAEDEDGAAGLTPPGAAPTVRAAVASTEPGALETARTGVGSLAAAPEPLHAPTAVEAETGTGRREPAHPPEASRETEATPRAGEERESGGTPDAEGARRSEGTRETENAPETGEASASEGAQESEEAQDSEETRKTEAAEKSGTASEPEGATSSGEGQVDSRKLPEAEQQTIRISLPADLMTTTSDSENTEPSGAEETASLAAGNAERSESSGDGAQTMALPPVPEGPMSDKDKRAAARSDYRTSLELEQPVSGAQLGKRYGLSENWGRRQINAAREAMRRERHPVLVGSKAK